MDENKLTGRPPKPVDWKLFEDLCELQCSQKEIASVLKLDRETLRLKVQDYYKEPYPLVFERFAEGGKASLRRTQRKLSQRNASMAIFLGKQYLGQKDNDVSLHIPPEIANQFQALMAQLTALQIEADVESPKSETQDRMIE